MSLKLATSSNTATTIGLTPTTSLMARVPFAINSGNIVPCYLEDNEIKFNTNLTYTTATGVTMTKDFDSISDLSTASTVNVIVNATRVGSISITSTGIASGFNNTGYLMIPSSVPFANVNSWEMVAGFTITGSTSASSCIYSENNASYHSGLLVTTGNKLYTQLSNTHSSFIGSGTGSTTLQTNTKYYVKMTFNVSQYQVFLSTTGEFAGEETTEITISSTEKLLSFNWNVGCTALSGYQQPFDNGTIDLRDCYIKLNGSMFWNGTTGKYKITLPSTGTQPYLFGGNVIVQDITPSSTTAGDVWVNPQTPIIVQKFNGTTWESFTDTILMDSDVSVSGNTISNLVAPTYNTNNIVNNSIKVSSLGKPSTRRIDLILGASGTDYVAPANGYFLLIYTRSSTSAWCYLSNLTTNIGMYTPTSTQGVSTGNIVWTMVKKGELVRVNYVSITAESFRFIYDEGEV